MTSFVIREGRGTQGFLAHGSNNLIYILIKKFRSGERSLGKSYGIKVLTLDCYIMIKFFNDID